MCAQEEEEHGVCTRRRLLARRSWDCGSSFCERRRRGGGDAFPESGEEAPLRGAATWAEELKSLRGGEKKGGDFSPGEKRGGRESDGGRRGIVVWDSPPRGRARAFGTQFSSPIHLFLSSTPVEKRCSRCVQLSTIRRMDSFDEKVLLRDEEKKFHFLIHALCDRAVCKSDGVWRLARVGSILSFCAFSPLFKNFQVEILGKEKRKYVIEKNGRI